MLNESVQFIFDQIRAKHAAKYGVISEGLPPGTQDDEISSQKGSLNSNTAQRMSNDPKRSMQDAGKKIAAAVQQAAMAANAKDNQDKGLPPANVRNAQPKPAKATPQDKNRRQKVLSKLAQNLDDNEDGQIDKNIPQQLKEHQDTAGRQVATHMITDANFTGNLAKYLKEEQTQERVSALLIEGISRLPVDGLDKTIQVIKEHFDSDIHPVVEFVLDIANGDLSSIVEGQTPEQISEGLAKKLAALGIAGALGMGAMHMGKGQDAAAKPTAQPQRTEQSTTNFNDLKVNRNLTQTAYRLARLAKRESLGGAAMGNQRAAAVLRTLSAYVQRGRMTPDQAIQRLSRDYNIDDGMTETLQSFFGTLVSEDCSLTERATMDGTGKGEKDTNAKNDEVDDEVAKAIKRREKALKDMGKGGPDAPAGHTDNTDETTQTSKAVNNTIFTVEQRQELLDGIFG